MKNLLLVLSLLVSSSSFAATYEYTCSFIHGDNLGDGTSINLKVTGDTIQYTYFSKGKVGLSDSFTGVMDKSYAPRANLDFFRYYTNEKGEYSPEYFVQKEMLTGGIKMKSGGMGGFMKFQARGEGYFGGTYVCFAKKNI